MTIEEHDSKIASVEVRPNQPPLLEGRGLHKFFGGARALNGASVKIHAGKVHALVGENGAGKSTLGRIFAGIHTPEAGEILIDGEPASYRSPLAALRQGIAIMQQELALAPHLTVAENVFLGAEEPRAGFTSNRQLRNRLDSLLAQTGFDLPPDAPVGSLRLPQQQEVTLLWAVARSARLIIMDEPTAALAQPEAEKLYTVVQRLRDSGVAILFISHLLEEVLMLADEITVMRNGGIADHMTAADASIDRMIVGMLGRKLESTFPEKAARPVAEQAVLRVENVSQPGVLDSISFEVMPGEVVGLFGLVGSGRSELAHALCGATRRVTGSVEVNGQQVQLGKIQSAMGAGLMLLPESRRDQGLFLGLNQLTNTSASTLGRYASAGWIHSKLERKMCHGMLESLRVEPLALGATVGNLSGGNQQKVLFAKCLLVAPKVLILDEPTRGVDIGAKLAIYELIARLAAEGKAVLMISSELEEITQLCHRALVMRGGRITTEVAGDLEHEEILNAAFGFSESQKASQLQTGSAKV